MTPSPDILLSDKRAKFAEEYCVDWNGTQAAIRAGYSPHTANEQAAALLAIPSVQEAIAQKKAALSARAGLAAETIVAELKAVAFADPLAIYDEQGGMTAYHQWPEELRRCVQEVIPLKGGVVRVKFADKLRALELLGRYLNLWDSKQPQGQGTTLHIHLSQSTQVSVGEPREERLGPLTITLPSQ